MATYYIGSMTFSDGSDILHYGVKGMKWGVRKFEAGRLGTGRRIIKALNRDERKIAQLKRKSALAKGRAARTGSEKQLEKYKAYEKEIKRGQDSINKILSSGQKNYKISSIDKTRIALGRKLISASTLGTPITLIGMGVRSSRYGKEAIGIVKGKKYYYHGKR